jgi:lincosamide nucleotidyltransferase
MESTEKTERVSHLLERLDAIGASLAETDAALALIGLGSVGLEMERLDDYSDLDFFVIVRPGYPGYKERIISDLSWLERAHPLAYWFQNTVDGHKALFVDGLYAEFAIFSPDELTHIPAAGARVVWSVDEFDASALRMRPPTAPEPRTVEWLVGELITNLYVGLCRLRRGETLSATRLIQGHAIDRLIDLSPLVEPPSPALVDGFASERRYEQRSPVIAASLPQFMQGYGHNAESARALLTWVEQRFEVNGDIRRRILDLCEIEDGGEAQIR